MVHFVCISDTKRCCHQVKVNNRWEDAGFRANDADNYVRFVYSLQDGTKLKDGDFRGDPRPLIVADERDLECPSIVLSLTRDDDKSNYGVVKYVTNAEFGVPNQVSPHCTSKEHFSIFLHSCKFCVLTLTSAFSPCLKSRTFRMLLRQNSRSNEARTNSKFRPIVNIYLLANQLFVSQLTSSFNTYTSFSFLQSI